MRTKTITTMLVFTLAMLTASAPWAGTWDGTLKLGGIFLDEEGDESTVQETFNIHDGFSVTQIRLHGAFDPGSYLMLNLHEVNLDGRRGDFLYRMPGKFKVTASFDQHRQVFDAGRAVTSERKDWKVGASVTPLEGLKLSGGLNYLTREGDRASFPAGTVSNLGTSYDYALTTGRVSAEYRHGRRGGAVTYRLSDYADELSDLTDRQGQVVSARLYIPCFFYDKWTHLVRGAYGKRELTDGDLDYTLSNFQYTGVVQPVDRLQFKYNFYANRVDNASTELKTDRFQNGLDVIYFYKYGRVNAGYIYETNDDDRSLTSYKTWRVGTAFRYDRWVKAKIDYSGRVKKDEEELTLLKDVEAASFRGDVEVEPVEWLTIGGGYSQREREYPDIDVEAEGNTARGHVRVRYQDWGAGSFHYTYSKDEYDDLAGKFDAESHVVTARADFEKIEDVRLSGGITYLEVGEDLDIQKYFFFVEGMYTVRDDYHLEVKYNRYEYDDFILADRYYTADVFWINVAYDLHFE